MAEFECVFSFGADVPLQDAEDSVRLALMGAEGLFGVDRVRADVGYVIAPLKSEITVSGAVPVAQSIADMTAAFLKNEFGAESFTIRRQGGGTGDGCATAQDRRKCS